MVEWLRGEVKDCKLQVLQIASVAICRCYNLQVLQIAKKQASLKTLKSVTDGWKDGQTDVLMDRWAS